MRQESKKEEGYSQQTQCQITPNTRLELNLDIQIRLKTKLKPIRLVQLALLLLRRRLVIRLLAVRTANRNLASVGARHGDWSIHGRAVGSDAFEWLHGFVLAVCVGFLQCCQRVGVHVFAVCLVLLDALAAVAAGL